MNPDKAALQKETTYKASRSGGKGGQNVNKVSSKVELLFSIDNSALFTDEEKELLTKKLQSRFNKDGLVQIICDTERSQYLNKEQAIERLSVLLIKALHKPKIRKPTGISNASRVARLTAKRINAVKKDNRKNDFEE